MCILRTIEATLTVDFGRTMNRCVGRMCVVNEINAVFLTIQTSFGSLEKTKKKLDKSAPEYSLSV